MGVGKALCAWHIVRALSVFAIGVMRKLLPERFLDLLEAPTQVSGKARVEPMS